MTPADAASDAHVSWIEHAADGKRCRYTRTSEDPTSSPSAEPAAGYDPGCSDTTTGAPAGRNANAQASSVGSSDGRRRVIVAAAPASRAAAGSAGRVMVSMWRVQCRPVHSGPCRRDSAVAAAWSTAPEGSKTVALKSESETEGARCAIETPTGWGSAEEPSTGKRDVMVAAGVGSTSTSKEAAASSPELLLHTSMFSAPGGNGPAADTSTDVETRSEDVMKDADASSRPDTRMRMCAGSNGCRSRGTF
mmetsp:Transcript_64656/g.154353  ORF Transcript_64656/g.154353 Transcript_64656/m.154353 type:complete len:249 (+) Transcript_64656:3469-4215(+)